MGRVKVRVYWIVIQDKFTLSKLRIMYHESCLFVVLMDLVH